MDLAAACELVGFKWLPQNVCKWLQVDTKWLQEQVAVICLLSDGSSYQERRIPVVAREIALPAHQLITKASLS